MHQQRKWLRKTQIYVFGLKLDVYIGSLTEALTATAR